jgi:hypothetical protein
MTFNRYIYGTVAIAFFAAGTAIYYDASRQKHVRAPDEIEIAEGFLERCAAVGGWPFTYTVTNRAGWNTAMRQGAFVADWVKAELTNTYGVATWDEAWAAWVADWGEGNEETAWSMLELFYYPAASAATTIMASGTNYPGGVTNWSYNPFNAAPMIGSATSRDRLVRYMLGIEGIASSFIQRIDSSNNPVYYTFSNLCVAAGIGDGITGNWTIWVATNGCGYGPATNLSFMPQTNVLWEMFRGLSLMTTTSRSITGVTASARSFMPPVPPNPKDTYAFTNGATYTGEFYWSPDIYDWYSNAYRRALFALTDAYDPGFAAARSMNLADYAPTSSAFSTIDYFYSGDEAFFGASWAEVWHASTQNVDTSWTHSWGGRLYPGTDTRWRRGRDCSNLVGLADFPSGVVAELLFPILTTGCVAETWYWTHWFAASPDIYSTTIYHYASSWFTQRVTVVFTDEPSTNLVWAGISNSVSLDQAYPGFDTAVFVPVDVPSPTPLPGVGYSNPIVRGGITNICPRAYINWTFTRCVP